ncbi:MAG: hypothetical protein ABW098_08065 [Candidatus Thiodiazotropha sp.]
MPAIRLTFNIIEGKPQLKTARRLSMRVPPQQKISNIGRGGGIWVELRDKEGIPLYQRVIDTETFSGAAEIPTGAADKSFARVSSKQYVSLFNIVIPDNPQGHSFHILEQRSADPKKKPVELISLDINKACPPESDKEGEQ